MATVSVSYPTDSEGRRLLECDRCGRAVESVYRMTSALPERSICQVCWDRNQRFYNLHCIGVLWAWQEFGEEGGW